MSLIMTSWTLSMIFMFLNHPLSFGFIILLQTIVISLISGILNLDFWFSYILFLIMIGGLLVLFIYMTSIASNEKFKFSKNLCILSLMVLLIAYLKITKDEFILKMNIFNYDSTDQITQNFNLSMNKFTNLPMMFLMILLMMYLLITLISIVKITQSKMGPLRSNY
uniref:NADH-ubiquinone oxidoreductase chain 6 n=1 Tax=Romualdius bifoveolatus TaxID=1342232 RepID=A0A343C3W9_9CUCU|nr:NADH dehydrogenase subunit 6 [Romualdius bifoveolatus]